MKVISTNKKYDNVLTRTGGRQSECSSHVKFEQLLKNMKFYERNQIVEKVQLKSYRPPTHVLPVPFDVETLAQDSAFERKR